LLRKRLASRVLAPLARFAVRTEKDVYRHALDISWHQLFSKNRTFAVTFNVANSIFKNGQYAALLLKDAVCDRFRQVFGARPTWMPKSPFVLHLFVDGDAARFCGLRRPSCTSAATAFTAKVRSHAGNSGGGHHSPYRIQWHPAALGPMCGSERCRPKRS
jgi:hypothetical protein